MMSILSTEENKKIQDSISRLMEEKIRPFIQSHGGDVQLIDFADGAVQLELSGACSGCPSADLGTKGFIENILCVEGTHCLMKRAVKYCGGCNPRYDRGQYVRELEEKLNEPLSLADRETEYDELYVICGCSARCVDISGYRYRKAIYIDPDAIR